MYRLSSPCLWGQWVRGSYLGEHAYQGKEQQVLHVEVKNQRGYKLVTSIWEWNGMKFASSLIE